MITLDLHAREKSSVVLELRFFREDGSPEAPATLHYKLTSDDGSVVLKDPVTVAAPMHATFIALSGEDLRALAGESFPIRRRLYIEATYASALVPGLTLDYREEFLFHVDDLVNVAAEA